MSTSALTPASPVPNRRYALHTSCAHRAAVQLAVLRSAPRCRGAASDGMTTWSDSHAISGGLACSTGLAPGPRPLTRRRGGRGPRWPSWGDGLDGLGAASGFAPHGRWAIDLGVVARRGGSRRREGAGGGPHHGRIRYQRLRWFESVAGWSSPRRAFSTRRAAHQQAIE